MCDKCEEHESEIVSCGLPRCGRYRHYKMGFPIAMCIDMGLNGECDNCPCGEFCKNVYKYDLLCFNHSYLDKEGPNG